MGIERGVVSEDWRSIVIVPQYKVKGEKIKCKNYRGIIFLIILGKIYVGILVDRDCTVTEGLINDG